jgi:hypothetical protein
MGLLEEILNKQEEILSRLKYLEKSFTSTEKTDTSFINSKEIMSDLQISHRTFHRMKASMPFLMRVGERGNYKARKCDFENWKLNKNKQ